jgi:YggT family protein
MVPVLITLIRFSGMIFTWLLIAYVVLSYFMSPYHPVRQTVNRIVEPFLMPIRRYLPTTGGLDFSPMVLIVLVQVLQYVLTRLLLSL